MTHVQRHVLFVLLLSIGLLSISQAQREREERNSLHFSYLVFERPAPDADSSYVDFLFRIPGNQFVFLKDQSTGGFIAHGEVFVEFRNIESSAIVRDFATIEIRRKRQVRDQDDIEDYQGLIHLRVPRGEYRTVVEVKDDGTGRSFLDRSGRYTFGLKEGTEGILANPMFGYMDTLTGSYVSFNRGRSMRFGSRGVLLLSIRDTGSSPQISVDWSLRQTTADESFKKTPIDSSIQLRRGSTFVSRHPLVRLAYDVSDSSTPQWTAASIPLPLERLEPGTYELKLSHASGEDTYERTITFPVVWTDKPVSLSRFDLAVDALRYIASEEDIDDMVGFMAYGGRERFREFWIRKDPDPSTAYNEVMAEYYRRVDISIRRFSTQGELDGYKTDRGRIFILFGTPSSSNRIFRPDIGPREVWEYTALKKRFIFTDPSRTGEYTLSKTEDL